MKKWIKRLGATAPMAVALFGLACHDGARPSSPDTAQEEALDAFEADLLSKGATLTMARAMREAIQLEEGQMLKVAPAGSFESDSGVVRRISLPDGQEAAVVWESGS